MREKEMEEAMEEALAAMRAALPHLYFSLESSRVRTDLPWAPIQKIEAFIKKYSGKEKKQ